MNPAARPSSSWRLPGPRGSSASPGCTAPSTRAWPSGGRRRGLGKTKEKEVAAFKTKYISLPGAVRRLWSLVPLGGSLSEEVWRQRHRFLVGLTWFHAVIIALVGPVLGYSWELSFEALFRNGTVAHTLGEGLIVAFFAALAAWRKTGRPFRATTVGFGLMSSS